MRGEIKKDGTMTITVDLNCEKLLAPIRGKYYLPCEACGSILMVDMRVVSSLCSNCELMASMDT